MIYSCTNNTKPEADEKSEVITDTVPLKSIEEIMDQRNGGSYYGVWYIEGFLPMDSVTALKDADNAVLKNYLNSMLTISDTVYSLFADSCSTPMIRQKKTSAEGYFKARYQSEIAQLNIHPGEIDIIQIECSGNDPLIYLNHEKKIVLPMNSHFFFFGPDQVPTESIPQSDEVDDKKLHQSD